MKLMCIFENRGSQIVSLLLAATVLLSVFAQTATGNSACCDAPILFQAMKKTVQFPEAT